MQINRTFLSKTPEYWNLNFCIIIVFGYWKGNTSQISTITHSVQSLYTSCDSLLHSKRTRDELVSCSWDGSYFFPCTHRLMLIAIWVFLCTSATHSSQIYPLSFFPLFFFPSCSRQQTERRAVDKHGKETEQERSQGGPRLGVKNFGCGLRLFDEKDSFSSTARS